MIVLPRTLSQTDLIYTSLCVEAKLPAQQPDVVEIVTTLPTPIHQISLNVPRSLVPRRDL